MQPISSSEFMQHIAPEALNSGSIFGALSSDAIDFLLNHGKLYKAHNGDQIFDYGDKGDHFFIVCKGRLDFFKEHKGECLHTRSVNFGEELGFVSMIALHDHAGHAVAHEDSILLEISSALYSELHEKFPFDFGLMTLNLAREMARTIRKLGNTLVQNSIKY